MFRKLLQQYTQTPQILPDRICLIWLGEDIPNTVERPYQDNAILHKKLNPKAQVEIIVSKAMLKEGRWDALFQKFFMHGITLRDMDETCQHYLNYDIIKELLKNPRDIIWACDLLRLALIYDQGGYYYDMDIMLLQALPEAYKRPRYGFYNYLTLKDRAVAADFCFHAAVPRHFIYLVASMISRHLYFAVQREIRLYNKEPEWLSTALWPVRHNVVCYLSGSPFMVLRLKHIIDLTNSSWIRNDLHYPLDQVATIAYHGCWLDQYQGIPRAQIDRLTQTLQNNLFQHFYERAIEKLTEERICSQIRKAFPGRSLEPVLEREMKAVAPMTEEQQRYLRYFRKMDAIVSNPAIFWQRDFEVLNKEVEGEMAIFQLRS